MTAGAGLAGWSVHDSTVRDVDNTRNSAREPFYGAHQSGITTAPQTHAMFLAMDLNPVDANSARANLRSILRLWTTDAARLTQGIPALADTEPQLSSAPASLTITVGLGPSVFERADLTQDCPQSAREFPSFTTDRLEQQWCGGDLLLQICANDRQPIAHAARVLVKNVRSFATERWRQSGFRTPRTEDPTGATMRNLMGQVDGTVNPTGPDLEQLLWCGGDNWLTGGTLLVLRRITMDLDGWDQLDGKLRDLVVGRRADTGAPLSGEKESDPPDLELRRGGIRVIPETSHIALARHRHTTEQFLRRPYNFDDPPPAGASSNSGLLFAAYQQDIATQFVPVQQRLAQSDAFNRWITTVGSAVFVIPPGTTVNGHLGQSLL